jgi:hypothetical protein
LDPSAAIPSDAIHYEILQVVEELFHQLFSSLAFKIFTGHYFIERWNTVIFVCMYVCMYQAVLDGMVHFSETIRKSF